MALFILVTLLLIVVPIAQFLWSVYTRSVKPHWRDERRWTFQPEEWVDFQDFLSQSGLALHSSDEFHNAPRPLMPPAPSPFHPQHDEDFVFRIVPRPVRTPHKMWRQPAPAIQLALDSCSREVIIKAVPPGSLEARILKRLVSPPLRHLPENQTIPVMSILHCHRATFLVHARWGSWWFSPSPCTLSFWAGVQAYQLLRGLAFMHDHGITHGDIYRGNIVCNFNELRTGTPCPVFDKFKNSASYRVAFIDFGQSLQFDEIGPHQIPCPRPIRGPPPEFRAPELDQCTTFDPFSADIFSLARLLLDLDPPVTIPAVYRTLLDDMTDMNPSCRPSARVAFQRLQALNEKHRAHWI
ncbi:kinase-like domain-containing protein [Mycena galopus ATCC 62051]|nr:kinase-like domain-containing protein [Mycena galopus ATCC 62051]